METNQELVVRTSQPDWLKTLAVAYKNRKPALLIDDAGLHVDPASFTLLQIAREAKLSRRETAGICVALGMSAAGIGMIVLAFVDPEPTSKLGLLVAGGVTSFVCGGWSAIRILTNLKPPSVRITARGIEIVWT
jgi:hypothetical protein